MKKLIYRIISLIIFILILIWIFLILISLGSNLIISVLIVIFVFLLGFGPIFSGFNKKKLRQLFHKPFLNYDSSGRENKMAKDMLRLEPPTRRPIRVSLDFDYNKVLIKKCKKCGMTLIKSARKCPNCGTKIID